MKLIKKNNAQAVVDKHAAVVDLRQHIASTEEQTKTFRDFESLRQEHAEALVEKDAQLECVKDEHA